jgi:hypothetical protein
VLAANVEATFPACQAAFYILNRGGKLLFGRCIKGADVIALLVNESTGGHFRAPRFPMQAAESRVGCAGWSGEEPLPGAVMLP